MSHKKNNRIFVILIMIICIILVTGVIYNNSQNKNNISKESNDNAPKSAPLELQSLIELQRDNWPSAILQIDCLQETTTSSKKYCLESQEILKKIYNK